MFPEIYHNNISQMWYITNVIYIAQQYITKFSVNIRISNIRVCGISWNTTQLYITKYFTLFPEIFCKKTTEIIQYFMKFVQFFPKYFHISHISCICQGFNSVTQFTMFIPCFTIFLDRSAQNVSWNTVHWFRLRFAAVTRAVRIPLLQCSLPPI